MRLAPQHRLRLREHLGPEGARYVACSCGLWWTLVLGETGEETRHRGARAWRGHRAEARRGAA